MRKVILTMNENEKYLTIKKLVETNGNKKRAALHLGCSERHINRMILGYKKEGKEFFVHGNHGRQPIHTLSAQITQTVLDLYRNKYFDSNFTHCVELLRKYDNISISVSTLHTILEKEYILSPAYFGEMLEMDASVHNWFGDEKSQLHIAVDDATGAIVGAYFDKQETLNGYYQIFNQILTDYGIPYMFLTDNRTVFEYKQKNSPSIEEDTYTQFAYACKQLGVEIKTSSVAQAKGRVERMFQTLQSRLPVELRLAGINTLSEANVFLNSYIKEHNAKFALQPNLIKSVFEKQPDSEAMIA